MVCVRWIIVNTIEKDNQASQLSTAKLGTVLVDKLLVALKIKRPDLQHQNTNT